MLLFNIEEFDPLEPCALRPDPMLDAGYWMNLVCFHPEMAIFRNLGACPACPVGRDYRTGVECEAYSSGVNLRDRLCLPR
jgi:hypothetical protein